MRILAVDVGERRVGIALSDPTQTLARSLLVLEYGDQSDALAQVADLVQKEGVGRVVVGYPLTLRGTVGPQADGVTRFVESLRQVLDVPVELWDERFSTSYADRILRGRGMDGRQRRRRIDATAAAVILQDYLDSRKWRRTRGGEEP